MKIRTFMEIFSNVTWIQVSLLEHISLPSLRNNKKKPERFLKGDIFLIENLKIILIEMQDTPDPVILSVSVCRNQMPCLYEPLTSVKQAYRPYIYAGILFLENSWETEGYIQNQSISQRTAE